MIVYIRLQIPAQNSGNPMAVCCKQLWIDKNRNRSELREKTGLSTSAVANMGRNEYGSTEVASTEMRGIHNSQGELFDEQERTTG